MQHLHITKVGPGFWHPSPISGSCLWVGKSKSDSAIAPLHLQPLILLENFSQKKKIERLLTTCTAKGNPTGSPIIKCHYFWHPLVRDRCIPLAADDILRHYHRKSNNEIGILKPLPHAKSNHLPLHGNRVWVKQSVTASSPTRQPFWQSVWIFTRYEGRSAQLDVNYP